FSLEGAIFIQSLKVVAVSVVLHALIGLGKKLTPDKSRLAIALVSAIVLLLYPSAWMQILIIVLAGLFGFRYFQNKAEVNIEQSNIDTSIKIEIIFIVIFINIVIRFVICTYTFYITLLDTVYGSFNITATHCLCHHTIGTKNSR